ncbi:MAG: hypothetical protein RQ754_09520 [Desulfuromonadales bacterium]|nr:hypothetical protein [Desulfuromonadales bacterium]
MQTDPAGDLENFPRLRDSDNEQQEQASNSECLIIPVERFYRALLSAGSRQTWLAAGLFVDIETE